MNKQLPKAISALVVLLTSSPLLASSPPHLPSFNNDVMPVFFRGGCNNGACHGAARGKDGFKLSLFGYDPDGDYYRLLEEYVGRRVNLAAPEKSLLLEKASGRVPHTGGRVFAEDSEYYQTLLRWISAGTPRDVDDAPEPVRLELMPDKVVFEKPGGERQAKVVAHYSDGTQRDVSLLAVYMTNNEALATIGKDAKIKGLQAGGTHVFARFDRFTVGTEVVVLPEGEFTYPDTPQHNYVDELVDAKLRELRITPSALCTDEHFLRRATIDLAGKLPTPAEYEQFMSDSHVNKRAFLVDSLLMRDKFGEVWAAQWGEWLRIYTDTNPGSGTAMKAGWNYYHWLREQMIENRPWDELARDLLTGNGSNLRNPPSNYYTMLPQGKVDPMKLGEDTAQIFLGLRTQCAQCHNHPFDRWTIDDYYSFTSFFTGVRRKHGSEAREYYTFIDLEAEPAEHLVDGRPMPHQFLGGGLADVANKDPRKVLANWMTTPDNTLFRRNLANRIWAHFFGRGIVHPVDDVRISNPPSNEPLLEELGRRLAEDYGYDAKKLVRDICLSRTYQLSARTNDSNRRDESRFSHAYLRRLRSDVLFDCISDALDYKHRFRRSTAQRAIVMFEGGRRDDYNNYFFQTFGQARRESVCTCETQTDASLSQALHLINGKTIDDAFWRNPVLIPHLIEKHSEPTDVIKSLYIRILSRKPLESELQEISKLSPDVSDQKAARNFYSSIAWALVNSNEFIFNH
ncbi:MAG: DUF1549 domain-containing protein [Planctomycetaceae bacterium]|nr:DUF1549 domain-containing protein [Planctomycetaceae bacterium]